MIKSNIKDMIFVVYFNRSKLLHLTLNYLEKNCFENSCRRLDKSKKLFTMLKKTALYEDFQFIEIEVFLNF